MQLDGQSVLIVEDEPIIALDVATALEEMGARVEIANTLKRAIDMMDQNWSAAIVDHHIRDETADPLYAELDRRSIPYVVCTGGLARSIDVNAIVICKPASTRRIARLVVAMVERGSKGSHPLQVGEDVALQATG